MKPFKVNVNDINGVRIETVIAHGRKNGRRIYFFQFSWAYTDQTSPID